MRNARTRPEPPTDPAPSGGKRAAVLRAARELFLQGGFAGTSVDAVTAAAGVSKPTVYSHFPTKDALLEAVLREAPAGAPPGFPVTDDARGDLKRAARTASAHLLSPDALAWDRLVTAEAGRRPDLAALHFDRGPGLLLRLLADFFRALDRSGRLAVDDPDRAADFFLGLATGTPLLRGRLGVTPAGPDESRDRRASDLFLRAYPPPAPRNA